MKKKLVNKKVVNSIGIGILAAMTAATPIMAQAAEIDGIGTDGLTDKGVENSQTIDEHTDVKSMSASESLEEEKKALETLNQGIENAKEKLDQEENKDLIEKVEDVNEQIEASEEATEKLKEEVKYVEGLNNDAHDAISIYEERIEENEKEENKKQVNDWVDGVSNAVESTNQAIDSVKENEQTAREKEQEAVDAQSKVYASQEEAERAKEQAQANADDAEAAYQAAQSAEQEAKEKLEATEVQLSQLKDQYELAQRDYEAAVEAVRLAEQAWRDVFEEDKIVIDGVEYEGNSETAKQAAQAAIEKARVALETANSELSVAIDNVKEAEANRDVTQTEVGRIGEIVKTTESDRDEAFKKLLETEKDADVEAKKNAYQNASSNVNLINIAVEKIDEANKALEEKNEADKALAEAETALAAAQEKEQKYQAVEEKRGEVQKKYDNYQNQQGKLPYEIAQDKEKYYREADQLAQEMIKLKLEQTGFKVNDSFTWDSNRVIGENNNVYFTYEKDGKTFGAYFDYTVNEETGDINVLQKSLTYKSSEILVWKQKELTIQILGNDVVVAVDGKEVPLENVTYDSKKKVYVVQMDGQEITFKEGNKVTDFQDGKGKTYFTATDFTDEKTACETDVENKLGTHGKASEAAGDAQEKLNTAKGDADIAVKNANLDTSDIEEVKNALDEARNEKNDLGDKLVIALGSYANRLKDELDKQVEAVDVAKNKEININDNITEIKKVEDVCNSVIKTASAIATLTQQQFQLENKHNELKTKYDSADTNYKNANIDLANIQQNLINAFNAAVQARAAANGIFAFNTPSEGDNTGNEDDDNQGGTTGGDETGGTTGGGNAGEGGTGDTGTGGTATDEGTTGGAGEEGGAATDTGAGTDATDPTLITTIADAGVPLAPTALTTNGNVAVANAGAGMTANRRAAGNRTVRAAGEDGLAGEGDEEDLVTVEDEEVPLAAIDSDIETNETEEKEEDLTAVADEEVPLANLELEQEQSKMSWWWLLIIAICGATGYEMYRRHKKNQKQEEVK